MSEELKRYFESIDSGMFPCDKGEEGEWVKYEDVQLQLSQYKAHIERLTETIYLALPYVECYEGDDDFKQDKIKRDSKLIRNVLANPSTTTSLEQVKMDSAYKAVMGILDMDYWCETPTGGSAYSENQIIEYANNLKEQV